ncbi:MAG TPA: metallophosphoesterase [Clostridiaceae bacterium]|nr:metallophosphoesterase [Clostridiaceae bacterium]
MTYIYIAYIAATVILLLISYMCYEARNPKLERIELSKSKSGLKIMQLSDIHINLLRVSPEKVKKLILKEMPDLLIITGDYIDHPRHIPDFISFLEGLKTGVPIFLCLGNHDWRTFQYNQNGLKSFVGQIEKAGATVLENNCITIVKGRHKYNIIGFSDFKAGCIDLSTPFDRCSKDAFMNIAFSHNPDLVLALPKQKVDLFMCGHFHGGQIWTPFSLEFKTLRDDKLCKMGIRKGLHKVNGINIYINRGLGNVVFPLRFLSRPEVTVYQLP